MLTKSKKQLIELTAKELQQTNGGANSFGSSSISMSSSTDSLLSIDYEWRQGNNYKHYTLDAGKNINFNLNIPFSHTVN